MALELLSGERIETIKRINTIDTCKPKEGVRSSVWH